MAGHQNTGVKINYFGGEVKDALHSPEILKGLKDVGGPRILYYAYIITSIINKNQRYIGFTEDLGQRLKDHNSGKCPHTAKYKPWNLKFYAAFDSKENAMSFEKYLKSGSGHSFAKRHDF